MSLPDKYEEENAHLMRYAAEKSKNVKSPLSIAKLCKQFKEEIGSDKTMECLRQRIQRLRMKIHESDEFDMDTKVEMLFALSVQIEPDFLTELRKEAYVKVDRYQRIIEYKKNGGGLEMSGKHMANPNLCESKHKLILQFLANKSETMKTPLPDRLFLREFKALNLTSNEFLTLKRRYPRIKDEIYESPNFDKATKIRMMFISSTKLPERVLKEANDGSLELEGEHSHSSKIREGHRAGRQRKWEEYNEEEGKEDYNQSDRCRRINLLKVLMNRTENATSPVNIEQLASEIKMQFGRHQRVSRLRSRIESIRENILEYKNMETPTKVKMMFALSGTVNPDFLRLLRNEAIVEVDENNRIIRYEAYDGSLKLEGKHSEELDVSRRQRVSNIVLPSDLDETDEGEEEDENTDDTSDNGGSDSDLSEIEDLEEEPAQVEEKKKVPIITRSGRVSRKRSLSIRSSCFDNGTTSEINQRHDIDRTKRTKQSSGESSGDFGLLALREHLKIENMEWESIAIKQESSMDYEHIPISSSTSRQLVESKQEIPLACFPNDDEWVGSEQTVPMEIQPTLKECKVEEIIDDFESIPDILANEDETALKEYLEALHGLVLKLNTPNLSDVDLKIKSMLEKFQYDEVPIDYISISLETCLLMVVKNSTMKSEPDNESKSLKNFIYHLENSIFCIKNTSLEAFKHKLRGLLVELPILEKKISIDTIRLALNTTLDILAPTNSPQ
ncbi:hypothetical protein GCK72_019810 [Caenorhabditis remanei]|uniref:SPK domain-containing protein n=1 Tax=Caenorhabditis remanei TaxID=31234 RepID=A0A6A5GET8_CAERE|nr:hypothetical protein GCK72_019810 [Caenorhabditis remanei]KAF1753254.1 hypothetical protein GCK72_019810 [Caenorhabditis remanei]